MMNVQGTMPAPASDAPSRPLRVDLRAADGVRLAADVFEPAGPARGAVVVAPALAVKRRLYAPFAAFLAAGGLRVTVLDYRGIGDSRGDGEVWRRARMSDWGELDLAAALRFAREQSPGLPLAHVGHSAGGQLLSLVRDAPVDAALFVASQSGFYRHWTGARRPAMAALWFAAIPALVAVRGHLPMRALGQGEDVPPGVARQWAEWGRHPRYIGKYLAERDGEPTSRLACPIRAYAIADDEYAPPRAAEALLALYPHATCQFRVAEPRHYGVRALGHFGVFRASVGARLWEEQRDWLLGALARAAAS